MIQFKKRSMHFIYRAIFRGCCQRHVHVPSLQHRLRSGIEKSSLVPAVYAVAQCRPG